MQPLSNTGKLVWLAHSLNPIIHYGKFSHRKKKQSLIINFSDMATVTQQEELFSICVLLHRLSQ